MKNLLNNLLNWVLKKGPSETKKDQAWEEKEQAGSKKEQAEQKGNKLGEKGTSLEMNPCGMGSEAREGMGSEAREVMGSEVREVMGSEAKSAKGSEAVSANHALITQLSRNNHPISLRAIRYAAVLFMVFMVGIGNVWGDTNYYLFTPTDASVSPAHTGTLSGQFYCGQSPVSALKTIDGVSCTHYVKTTQSVSSSWNTSYYAGAASIDYDIKTNSTDFEVYVYNGYNGNANCYYAYCTEGSTPVGATRIGSSDLTKNTAYKLTFSITASARTRVRIHTSQYSGMQFYQIVAKEKGTALPSPGEGGYVLDFGGKRFASPASKTLGYIDGMSIKPNSDIKYNATAPKLTTKGTDYISFTAATACKLKVSVSTSKTYYVANSSTGTTNAQTATHEFDLAAGTWYINPNGSDVTVTKIEFLSSCTPPNHVDISGDWDKFGGETISLTATAYSSAGTGSPIADGNITGWQWEKLVGSTWTALSNGTAAGVTTSGATTKNLQISNCGQGNSGKYRCVVSTGATCSTASATATDGSEGYVVKVYALECYTGGTTVYNFTRDGNNQRGSVSIALTASTGYEFKIHADKYYGNNGTINFDENNWTFTAAGNNVTVNSGLGGTFTFTIDYSSNGDVPVLAVTYPRKRIYLVPNSDWLSKSAKFAYYYFHKTGDDTDAEGWTDFLTEDDCGMYADIPQWNGVKMIAVRFNSTKTSTGNWSDKWNQTSDLTVTSNDLITITNWDNSQTYNSTYSTPTYTIGYAKGSVPTGGGSISGSKSNETKTCGVDFTLPSSAVFTTTGYTQTGWTTSDGGAQEYALGGTYTTNEDKTFYPVWTVNNYDLTWNLGGGTTTSTGTGISSGVSVNTTTSQAYGTALTAPTVTKANYTFSAWSPTVASTMPAEDVEYTATFTANQYSVTHTLSNVTKTSGATGANAATYGTGYSATFAASSGYTLPNSVTVTAGGSDITANCTYTKGTGTVSIPGSYITGNIVITVTGVAAVVCPSSASGETVYKFVTKSSDLGTDNVCAAASTEYPQTTSNSLSTLTGGTLKAYGTGSLGQLTFNEDCYKLAGSDNTWLIVELDCAIATGDVIRYVNYASSGNTVMIETTRGTSTSIVMDGNGTMMEQTIVAPAALNGVKTLYLTRKAGTAFLTSFEILRPYTVTLNASTNGGKVGGNSTATMYFKDSESQALPHAFKSSNYFTGWFEDDDSGDAVDNPYTATGTGTLYAQFDACASQTGSLYKFAVKNTLTAGSPFTTGTDGNASMTVGNYLSSLYGGTLDVHGRKTYLTNTTSAFTLANNSAYLLVTLDCPLQAGDQIKSIVSSSSVAITTSSSRSTTNTLATGTNTITIPAGFAGATTLYIWKNSSNGDISYLEIIRPNGVTITGAVSPDGYGTVSPASIFVASGSTVSLASNVLTCDGKTLTATPTAATAEYTYAFSSWSGVTNGGTVSVATTATANFTRTANNYTLAWSSNGGSELSGDYTSGSTAYGASITAPNDPTKSNYTFDGWKTNNDGTGTTAGATMPASDVTYYAAWKQTVTLTTGAQGEGGNQTPYVYLNGTGVSSITPHTASGYTLQGYYTAGSGGVKVLNADGTFASANVDGYITSSKWSCTGAAPTLYAQWVAAEDCHTLKYSWKKTGNYCDDESTSVSDTVRFPANASNLYFTVSGTGNTVSKGSSYNLGTTQNNYFLLTAKSGYQIKSICFYGKVQDSSVGYTTDGSSWTSLASKGTGSDKYYSFDDIDAAAFGIKLTAASPEGVWIRNMVIEVCAAGGTTYNVTYDGNDNTSGDAPTDATNYSYGATVTVLGNTGSFAKTNYTFAGWTTNNDGTGSSYVEDNTFSITANTTLYAKWTQAVTFDANTANHGSTGGSATAVWNATGLTGITHATPASGYKLLGYYTDATEGTKVLNSDGTFASTAVTDYITSGKWSRTGTAPTLYAQYEASGSLKWNLGVKTTAESLTTSSKESSFTEISTSNMSNATVYGVTYTASSKNNLTGQISTPAAYDANKYVYVTFTVADGYKFTPSSISVKVQPVGENEHKAVKLSLADATNTLVSGSPTKCDGTSSGKTTTVILAGNGTYFTGTVTLKIYVYADETASATTNNCYRLGTPIEIQGAIEALCATMPSFTQMNYSTTTFAPSADASGSPITIVGGENIDTYQWKYNTVNDRTSGTNCGTGTSFTPLTDAGAAIDVTRYYWCEMTNTLCGITIKSPAVAITVAAAKSNATVTWTGTTASANYGGGGYTVTATVSTAEWDGTLTEDMLTAMDGVVLSNINVTNDGKTISADFGVTEGANAEATNVEFYLNHPATTDYNAIDETYNTTTLVTSCISAGGGDGSSYDVRVRKNTTTILQGKSTVYGWDTPTKGFVTQNTGGSVTSTKSGYDDEPVFDSISKGNAKAYWVKSYVANVKKIRVYGQVGDDDLTATGVYHVGSFVAGGSSTAVAYSVIYEDEVDALKKGNHWFEITLDEAISTNDIIYFTVNKNFKIMGVRLTTVGAGGATLATALSAWSPVIDTRKEVNEDAASFVETVTKTGANANTMGAITYSSGDETIATVDNRTGRVTIANNITWGDAITYKDVTITASLAPSGCYQGKTATYTLRVNKLTCTEAAGTITASSEGSHVVIEGDEVKKCTSETVTLTLGGYEEGATSFQWYKDGVLQGDKTTASITTSEAGVWYAVSNKGCAVTSTNEITIINRSTSAHVTRLVKEWYIKNGRLTPDIALWELGDDCSFVGVTASSGWDAGTGLTEAELGEKVFYEKDGIVYLKGTEPNANAGAVQNYTLTLTVNDGCSNQTLNAEGKEITIHHQQNTDKHVLAFVVRGTEKGGWTDGVTADQTTNVGLYNAIAENFDVIATNSWSTDDEQKLKEYYSQFDILCITDYPDTKKDKGANKKSTVDALGALVDIRPILTMEAWVSGLANWRAKGISGNPKSPTTRQYTMDLQCKDHEIFAGTKLTKVGEGDEAMYRVSMVDNTKEEYVSLDATYGGGAHAEKEGYQYGKKPALQGFTFTQEMIDNDLLPIGLIDDGAGNPLQVGIERQHNMEARLMVLGINSYAMERLTVDGERVVINALNYLMKKNAEDIADCSTSFVGGAEGDTKNWDNKDNWTGNTVPLPTQKVRILADCEVSSTVYAQSVLIVTGGKYNHGSDVAAGKLTIKENGALIVGGKIQAALAPAYNRPRATTPDELLIETSSTNQAALIFDNEEAETQATVKLYSLGRKPSSYQYQYFAVPMEVVPVNPTFANETHGGTGIYTYVYSEATSGWTRRKYYDDLFAFEGLGITTKSTGAMNYTMTGNLASTATKEITLTHDGAGLNLIGNSWMAPIQIGALAEDNTDANITKTVYIYCAGRDAVEGAATSGDTETAGQWIAIPFEAAEFETWKATGKLSVIPAMQAFQIKVSDEATLTLDYDKVVRGSTNDLNAKLRAPGRRMAANEVTMTNIRVSDSKTHTDLSLFEGDRFSEAFDNGWEAEYMSGDGRSAKLYAETEAGQMAVVAMYDYEGTVVGFMPGQETEYTFSFMGEDNGYYLNDIKLQNSVRISEGETYTFTYEEGDAANRFYISRTAINAPEVATGMENLDAAAPRVQKIIYNDKLYIIRGGRLYDVTGKVVK